MILKNKLDKKKKIKKQYIILSIIVFTIILIDQLIKIYVSNVNQSTIIPNILELSFNKNTNSDYGMPQNSLVMNIIANLIIIAIIIKFITTQNDYIDQKFKIFLSFILAGGISNLIDRIFRGYVLEYINITAINIPKFNIADIFVIIGWISVAAIFASFTVKELRQNKINKEVKRKIEEEKNQKSKDNKENKKQK